MQFPSTSHLMVLTFTDSQPLGKRFEWMRANPLVCLEVDQIISENQWMSIVVFGQYEELPDKPEYEHARIRAHAFLKKRAM
jgi:nitroimidazol reductase NimA-like FMN-containing flavoprotein (pyridoxamine 5'-phosphate oxidase superfamily)